jgi:predicted enzyme related to lactoylglutathione lyase
MIAPRMLGLLEERAMQHGHFVWNELIARDVEKAKAFYAATLGWRYEKTAMPNGKPYWIANMDGTPVAGLFEMADLMPDMPDHVPSHWFSYIEVDDVNARVRGIEAAGGRLMREVFDVPDVGRLAILADAAGAPVGWVTSVKR